LTVLKGKRETGQLEELMLDHPSPHFPDFRDLRTSQFLSQMEGDDHPPPRIVAGYEIHGTLGSGKQGKVKQ
jgi:hypothetical protein